MNSDEEMTWVESLYVNYTDGILIIHKGHIVYERYFGCLDEDGKHVPFAGGGLTEGLRDLGRSGFLC